MKYGRYGWSHLFMSWGLGIVFLWIGLDMLVHADTWIGYIPDNVPFGISREQALLLSAFMDIAIGGLLIMRWWEKLVAGLAVLHLLGILITSGIDAVLIRDVGLLGLALALLMWPAHYRKRRVSKLMGRFRFRKKSSGDED